jgi:hypothetical protein
MDKLIWQFSKEEVQITNKYINKCSTSLAIKEMQTKMTLKFLLTTVRKTTIKKTNGNKCWWGCRGKRILIHCWYESKLVQPPWKSGRRFLKKLKLELPYHLTTLLLGIYPKQRKPTCKRATGTPIDKQWNQPRSPTTDDWIKKMRYIHTMEYYYSAIKNNEIMLSTGK